jgi:hypothetical protein
MSEPDWLNREYPPPTPSPCNDCPWRRVATKGWLGPHDAIEWLQIAHGESAIACHQTIKGTIVNDSGENVGDWSHPAMRQCRGAAIFREHVMKSPRNPAVETGPPDPEHVFVTNAEFIEHHTGKPMTDDEIRQAMFRVELHTPDYQEGER